MSKTKDNEFITRKEFEKFLEELNVVFADIHAVSPEFAWKHYNNAIYDLKAKKNKM